MLYVIASVMLIGIGFYFQVIYWSDYNNRRILAALFGAACTVLGVLKLTNLLLSQVLTRLS